MRVVVNHYSFLYHTRPKPTRLLKIPSTLVGRWKKRQEAIYFKHTLFDRPPVVRRVLTEPRVEI